MTEVIFESPGEWWLPSNESRRIPGILRIDPAGALRIDLFEALDEDVSNFGAAAVRPVLHGSLHKSPLSGGTEVTHFDSFAVRRSLRGNGTSAEQFVANGSYVGDEHLEASDQPYGSYGARFTGLSGWLPFSTVKRSARDGKVAIEVERPIKWTTMISGARVEFGKAAGISYSDDETAVREHAEVIWTLDAACPADAFRREFLVPLEFLLTLALGEKASVDKLDIVLSDGVPWPHEVHDLTVWGRAARRQAPAGAVHARDALIAPPQDESHLQQLIESWRDVHARMRPAIDRMFALWEEPPKFVEVRFGAVCDVFELLSRGLPSGPEPSGVIEHLGPAVTADLPPGAQIVERYRDASRRLNRGERSDMHELLRLSELQQWLMRFILLRELGVDLERAARAPAFRHVAQKFRS